MVFLWFSTIHCGFPGNLVRSQHPWIILCRSPRLVRQRCGEWHFLSLGDAVPAEGVETSAGAAGDPRGMGISLGGFCRSFRGKKTGKKCLKQRPKLLENWSGKRIFVCMSKKNIWCHPLVINCFRCLQYERGMGLYYGIFPLCINNSNHYSNYSVLSCIIHTLYIN